MLGLYIQYIYIYIRMYDIYKYTYIYIYVYGMISIYIYIHNMNEVYIYIYMMQIFYIYIYDAFWSLASEITCLTWCWWVPFTFIKWVNVHPRGSSSHQSNPRSKPKNPIWVPGSENPDVNMIRNRCLTFTKNDNLMRHVSGSDRKSNELLIAFDWLFSSRVRFWHQNRWLQLPPTLRGPLLTIIREHLWAVQCK